MLIELMDDPERINKNKTVTLPSELIVRQSTQRENIQHPIHDNKRGRNDRPLSHYPFKSMVRLILSSRTAMTTQWRRSSTYQPPALSSGFASSRSSPSIATASDRGHEHRSIACGKPAHIPCAHTRSKAQAAPGAFPPHAKQIISALLIGICQAVIFI